MYHDIINSGVYINKIKPLAARGLFNYTFTPDSYIYRKDGSKRRTVFKLRNYNEYLTSLTPVKKSRTKTVKAKRVVDTDNINDDESNT